MEDEITPERLARVTPFLIDLARDLDFPRRTIPEGTPGAVRDPWTGRWMEGDEPFVERFLAWLNRPPREWVEDADARD